MDHPTTSSSASATTNQKLLLKKKELEEKRERLRQLRALRAKKKLEADSVLMQGVEGGGTSFTGNSSVAPTTPPPMLDGSNSFGSLSPRTNEMLSSTDGDDISNARASISSPSQVPSGEGISSTTTPTPSSIQNKKRRLHMTDLINLIDMVPTVPNSSSSINSTLLGASSSVAPEKICFSKGVEVNMADVLRKSPQGKRREDDAEEDEEIDDFDEDELASRGGTTLGESNRAAQSNQQMGAAATSHHASSMAHAEGPLPALTKDEIEKIESSTEYHSFVLQGTKYVERILNQKFDPLVDYTITRVKKKNDKEILSKEEAFMDEFSKERTVTAFDWSTLKPELFLVAYADKMTGRSAKDARGGVLIWSRYLPKRPEFELYASSSVTKALFHPYDVNLVLGATKAGHILQWDLSVAAHPIQQTPINPEYHTHQICGLKLVGTRHSPTVVSLCTDGMVCVWSLSNFGKPVQRFHLSERATKSMTLNPNTSAYCFSFPTDQELSRFYVGTESGAIYSSEIYGKAKVDREYLGHYGPVTAIDFHPSSHFKDLLLTCSVDWTVRLWSTKHSEPLHVFSEYSDYVYDVKWSPVHPAVFATVDGEGCLKVWNLDNHRNMPIYSKVIEDTPTRRSLNQLMFSPDGSKIIVGSIGGDVQLLRLEDSLWRGDQNNQREYKEFVNWRKKLEMR
uniref:Guanine nucleotide-binding protein subunit beta-like protein n=1 Tax=Percolomonas cosmopolitus TaxID=63605 RepID=A0A7S1KLW8_9EUKA|mmetsp:Transcript_11370/g.42665  ORF Transcript_11370/g.42665 Transcript_11370/m.42665 type:complete len:681 (+) Transcript_11370:160-2202(+)|eukprot:CAMPEP_0117438840 /NCGR_PEP_ID=MMETSP0759-20121206/2261_1 /TAXON_ID=63605 /ORGANISM="Percolomonas cosmopolitus, Strain WS" /LENGTH=680 /DNA_ID=CAMNT_0005230545 /DNA_START=103 /DNA_END=2145 /DNA_ORIENTATION=+